MKKSRLALLALSMIMLTVPMAYAINFIGPINYIATHGGTVRFGQNFQAESLTYFRGLNFFTTLLWGGTLRGSLGFDADTNVLMNVASITGDTVTYTVTTAVPGGVNTYLYYRRNVGLYPVSQPTDVTGGTWNYNQNNGVLTVTTTGSPRTVVVTYGSQVSPRLIEANLILAGLLPFLVLMVVINDIKEGAFGMGTAGKTVMLIIAIGIMAWVIQGWGY